MYNVIYILFYNIEYLEMLVQDDKNFFVKFGHATFSEWTIILSCDENVINESNAINAFTSDHAGIAGLILTQLGNDVTID